MLDPESLEAVVGEAEGLSFAQLRESYIFAGQLAFDSHSMVGIKQLRAGVHASRQQMTAVKSAGTSARTGFDAGRESSLRL